MIHLEICEVLPLLAFAKEQVESGNTFTDNEALAVLRMKGATTRMKADMTEPIRIIGVHPIPANGSCHLLEIELQAPSGEFDFGLVTQEMSGQPKANWQVAYDEQQVGEKKDVYRWAFFFHCLDFDRPLLTPFGPISLPRPTPVPQHLKAIQYYEP